MAILKSEVWIKRLLAKQYRAGIRSRFFAFIYDMFCLYFVWVFVGIFTSAWMVLSSDAPLDYNLLEVRDYILQYEAHRFYINIGIQLIAVILYIFVLPIAILEHRTLGMMLLGIKFLDENADEITTKVFLKREILKWILFPGFFLSLSKEKRSTADKLSGTYVTYY
ncbi:RDD family protein [Anaerobacillus sp. CMMVII]|uniref:RDD family protein n=1 Tax=Anaerobacillus sp. CMMVII TaxID=2755588 RepID=UPI0021B72665|nr:RDD family protein [Anaerobacillus sp. CMMVII]MCT8138325.1 RDD family protein [Anaerobacillus sp. CMMVII]